MNKPQPLVYVTLPHSKLSGAAFELIHVAAVGASVTLARVDQIKTEKSLREIVRAAISDSKLVIADISDGNPNVMYEVGLAQAFNKPILFLASSSRRVPFDLSGARVFIYDINAPGECIDRLTKAIRNAIESPKNYTDEGIKRESEKKQSVFISYSHEDTEYLDRLLIHLKPLEREGLIDLWVDTRLRAGDRWKKEIEKALAKSNVAVLMVSADFLASDFITSNELPPLLRDAEEKGTRIIPVIVKPCRFKRDRNLLHFQAINDPKNSLILLSTGQQELLYDSLCAEIERSIKRG